MSKKDQNKKEREALLRKLDKTLKQVDESTLAAPPSLSHTALSGLLSFVAAAFIAWYFSGAPQAQLSQTSVPQMSVLPQQSNIEPGKIPIITLPRPSVSFFSKHFNMTSPYIFRGSVVDQWRARSTWTFESLLQRPEVVNHHLLSLWDSCEMRVETESSLEGLTELYDAISEVDVPQRDTLDWKTMIEMGKDSNSQKCASVRLDSYQNLINELQPITQLYVPSAASTRTIIRVDSRNVFDSLSYYQGHQFYVLLSGEAQVVLIPSAQLDRAHLFPSISPFAQQSQVSLWPLRPWETSTKDSTLDPQPKSSSRLQDVQIFETRLRPGDVLAIPPYWLSSVISLQPSVSILFSSETDAQQSASSILNIPFRDLLDKIVAGSPKPISRSTASYLLAAKLAFLRGDVESDLQSFFYGLLKERYEPLLGDLAGAIGCDLDVGAQIPSALASEIEGLISSHTEFFFSLDYTVQMTILKDAMERVAAYADQQNAVRTLRCWASLDASMA